MGIGYSQRWFGIVTLVQFRDDDDDDDVMLYPTMWSTRFGCLLFIKHVVYNWNRVGMLPGIDGICRPGSWPGRAIRGRIWDGSKDPGTAVLMRRKPNIIYIYNYKLYTYTYINMYNCPKYDLRGFTPPTLVLGGKIEQSSKPLFGDYSNQYLGNITVHEGGIPFSTNQCKGSTT